MDDYISRQAAIDAIDCDITITGRQNAELVAPTIGAFVDRIKALPSADVVQVVRCDDCKYYGSRRWCELHSSVFDDNAFCSYGERKEREA